MFTPGDNDWTDCDSASNGGFNSLERLDHERQVFFSTPFSLGQRRKRQEVQSAAVWASVEAMCRASKTVAGPSAMSSMSR